MADSVDALVGVMEILVGDVWSERSGAMLFVFNVAVDAEESGLRLSRKGFRLLFSSVGVGIWDSSMML